MKTRKPDPTLCIVVPCFNEEAVLPRLFERLINLSNSMSSPVRILLVDDGSSDSTPGFIEKMCEKDDRFACVRLSRNFGHQVAVTAGLEVSEGDLVAVLDADLQDPPEEILRMIEKWREGYDVVFGVRTNRKEWFLLRAAYAVFYRLLRRIAKIDIPLDAGDFSLMDRRVVDHINSMPEHSRFVRGLRGWVGFRQTGLAYERDARQAGIPKYNVKRLTQLAIDGIVSFSSVPLRIASFVGVVATLVGVTLAVWAICSVALFREVPSGWASLLVVIIFFSGVQLTVLGIIGEYVGRIFQETKRRPLYITDDLVGWASEGVHRERSIRETVS
jgi:dolichol-phosphate mannosyltransferase